MLGFGYFGFIAFRVQGLVRVWFKVSLFGHRVRGLNPRARKENGKSNGANAYVGIVMYAGA